MLSPVAPFISGLFVLAVTIGCVKKETVEVPQALWGSAAGYQPISKMPQTVRDAGQAVAQVQYMAPFGATGFFISADGLFLTNHHVIPREVCNQERCAGIRIVRDASAGGAYEVFYDFDVIAQDAEFDFTLLKVHLPKGRTVPYLKIETAMAEIEDEGKFPSSYLMLGHPALSSLYAAQVIPTELDDEELTFKGIYIGGNSGGPLIDAKTGKVLAIGHSSEYSEIRSARGFSLKVDNNATSMLAILERLTILTGSEREIDDGDEAEVLLSNLAMNYREYLRDDSHNGLVREKLIAEAKTDLKTALKAVGMDESAFPVFTNQFLGSNLEAEALRLAIPDMEVPSDRVRDLAGLESKFFFMELVGNNLGRILPFSKMQVENVAKQEFMGMFVDPAIFKLFDITPTKSEAEGMMTMENCVPKMELDGRVVALPSILSLMTVFQCPPDAERLRSVLSGVLREADKPGQSVGFSSGPSIFIIKAILQRKTIEPAEVSELISFASQFMTRTKDVSEALMLEGAVTMLATRPELALKGNWRPIKPFRFKTAAKGDK